MCKPSQTRSSFPAFRTFQAFLACIVLPLVLPAPLLAQDFTNISIEVSKVTDGIYMLKGQGGNIGLSVGGDGAFVIDDQFAPLSEKIQAAIATVSDKPVKFVVNTHWHGDHTGGNEGMTNAGAIVIAHDNVRNRLLAGRPAMGSMPASPGVTGKALPIVTFSKGVTFHWNDQTIDVKHVSPSHTDGDSFIIFKPANVIHTGDVYVSSGYPYIDTNSGGNIHGFIANAKTLLTLTDKNTVIIPGHGPLASRADVEQFLHVLELAVERIGEMRAKGMSMEEIVERKPMVEFDGKWGQGFMTPDKFVASVYSSL